MRVARFEIRNHPGIGDLDIDFRNADGSVPRLVVLAGENGCGKTAVLQMMHNTLKGLGVEICAPGASVKLFVETTLPAQYAGALPDPTGATIEVAHARAFLGTAPGFSGVMITAPGAPIILPAAVPRVDGLANILGTSAPCFYSSAQSTFRVPSVDRINTLVEPPVGQMTGIQIDSLTSTETADVGVEIAQLLVNLKGADDAELSDWVRTHKGQGIEPPANVVDRRIERLRAAFATVMPHKTFEGVVQAGYAHEPMFREDGRRMRLADLSMGEKQIILRGGFLLRSVNHLPNAVVLIDEPELGLHPNWQRKILDFYNTIVPDEADQPSQIIVATHSPFVVHGSPSAKHIVLKRDRAAQCVVVDSSAVYPGVTSEAVAIAAFDASGFLSTTPGNTMIVATEGKTDAAMLQEAWVKLRPGRAMPFNLVAAGGAKQLQAFLGHEPNVMGPLAQALTDRNIDRIIGIFDFDEQGFGQWNGTCKAVNAQDADLNVLTCAWRRRRGTATWSALLPVPGHRPTSAGFGPGYDAASRLTTELLFEDAFVASMLSSVPVAHGRPGDIRLEATDAQKVQIAAAAAAFPAAAFAPFEPILALIERVIQTQI
ncbi:ATP-binding protein [Methylobacterium sp. J-030]|uniref:AAA family ATPase n=1 Tax=Methylobacterium sp. J-030 TaxID=2836627 RepID=UPI001FB8B2FE|nr:ATP-binding protein [Methylobacterium sp. J-030]MCJ2070047.1 ATP-binding protein [Methylobacterium sp. J-030]